MTAILYGVGAYQRQNGNLPELRLRNMFLEAAVTGDSGVSLVSRRGLSPYLTVGSGPVTGVFSQEGVFGSDVFSVSGGVLFRGSTSIGVVAGTGPVSFAAGASDRLAVNAGAGIYVYDGSTLTLVSFPDDDDVSSIAFHDGLYFASVAGSDRWYWSNVLDPATWDALSFATAESKPDTIKDILPVGDFLLLIGGETIERWANTGAADAPYTRVEGAIIQRGALATGCSVIADETLFFVSKDKVVYRLGNEPTRVSDNGIEERIAASSSVYVFTFDHEGHSFVCIRLDTESFLYDITTQEWCEFATYDSVNWRAACSCSHGSTPVFGDDTVGQLWVLDGWQDDNGILERLFTAAFPLNGGVFVVDNLTVKANTGWTELIAGQGSSPIVEMRSSIDAGATWTNWRPAPLGEQGKYRTKTQWTRCGMFDFPGGMFEIRITDPVPFRISSVIVNEGNGGKSR